MKQTILAGTMLLFLGSCCDCTPGYTPLVLGNPDDSGVTSNGGSTNGGVTSNGGNGGLASGGRNNGFGNGDQSPPGNSADHNRGENDRDGRADPSRGRNR